VTTPPTSQTHQVIRVFATWRPWLVGAVAVATLSILIGISPAFKDCIHTKKESHTYHTPRENPGVISGLAVRLELHAVCVEDWTDKYEGPIAAVATVFIAIFTLTLWGATERLYQSAENELTEFRNSLRQNREIADQQVAKMEGSVQEAARAASAMERVATAMTEQRDLMHGQREIMTNQRDISAATQRAWVRADIKVAGPAKVSRGEVSITFTLELTNSGTLPAYTMGAELNVYPWGATTGLNDEHITDRWARFKPERVIRKAVIFPQQTVADLHGGVIQVSEIERADNSRGIGREGFVPTIRGAVWYDYPGNSQVHLTTFHVFVVKRGTPDMPSYWQTLPTDDGAIVPTDDLVVTSAFGETDAT
jgi:hypothetical protein